MGGRIGCTSELGRGSTFSLVVPFEMRKETEPSENVQPAAISILLIVEDCEENLWLMEAYLEGCGFELDFAENGEIAVEKVIHGHPDLVLMDLQMPVMDGLEATRRIRQWEAQVNTGPIPILALTAHAGGVTSSIAEGCNKHLIKPINKANLLEAISRHVIGKIESIPH
jgi:CheY-like chemotaxis protein